jgi:hypothetical protein
MTLAELLIALAIGAGLMASLFGLVEPATALFETQFELADMHQRLRSGVLTMERFLTEAGPPVRPYRIGTRRNDPAAGVFYRDDVISVLPPAWGDAEVSSHTFYLRAASGTAPPQLMHYDGADGDFPLADHIVHLGFEYFGLDGAPLSPASLQDGPWVGDSAGPFDATLLEIRRIQVTLRVEAARAALRGPAGPLFTRAGTAASLGRFVPDRQVRIDVAPRNTPDG